MKKTSLRLALSALLLLAAGLCASAEPLARVATFFKGDGMAEFFDTIDDSKITPVFPAQEWGDTVVLVMPLCDDCTVSVYMAVLDDDYRPVPDRDDLILTGPVGWGVPYWCMIPEGAPGTIVVLTDGEGEEHMWVPAYSGEDGSLITDQKFVPFDELS
ncbi:MAG: hypothetical protein QM446_07220 [Synergistota bacterium]|nr:hypothetical protein [Synergistota bacterium]